MNLVLGVRLGLGTGLNNDSSPYSESTATESSIYVWDLSSDS